MDEEYRPSRCSPPSSHMFGSFVHFYVNSHEFNFAIFRIFPLPVIERPKSQNRFCLLFLLFDIMFFDSTWECSSLHASTMPHYVDMSWKYHIVEAFCNSGIFCFAIEINFVFYVHIFCLLRLRLNFHHNIPKDTTNAVIWLIQHNQDAWWYNFTICLTLLFVLDFLLCCSCILRCP